MISTSSRAAAGSPPLWGIPMVRLSPHHLRRRRISKRIEILGAFGSGKTTIARALSEHGYANLLERHELNAFWTDSAPTRVMGYLPYDLWFLLHHAQLAASSSGTA